MPSDGLSFGEAPAAYLLLGLSLLLGLAFACGTLRERGHGPHKESGAQILRRRHLKRTLKRMGMQPEAGTKAD